MTQRCLASVSRKGAPLKMRKQSFAWGMIVILLGFGCGREKSDGAEDGQNGGTTGGGGASGGRSDSGETGDTDLGSGGKTSGDGSGGDQNGEPPLEPTADCIHPKVVEQCEGDFCRIEGGCFIMGAPPDEFGRGLVSSDQVQVTLTHPFWIGRTEVTRAQWDATGLPRPKLQQLNGKRECLEPDCPQGNATVYDMLRYANHLSASEGLEPCYLFDGDGCTGGALEYLEGTVECPEIKIAAESPYECEGYRLPMEAEWEYAARAGTKTSFPTGNITPQKDTGSCYFDAALDQIGWYCKTSPDQAQRVALKPPNAWGLHDMHGNVVEVVNDLFGPQGYLGGPYGAKEGPLSDPTGTINPPDDFSTANGKQVRVARGGMHNAEAVSANVSWRLGGISDWSSASNLGFRIARTIHEGSGGAGGNQN